MCGSDGGRAVFDGADHIWRVCIALAAMLLPVLFTPHDHDPDARILKPRWLSYDGADFGVWAGKVGSHAAHHGFGRLGRLPHVQVNVWRVGVKGSGVAYRLPVVSPTRILMTAGQLFV